MFYRAVRPRLTIFVCQESDSGKINYTDTVIPILSITDTSGT